MNWLEISRIITVVASIAITVGIYAQVIKIFKTKSAKDFTIILIIALVLNELAWFNYGLALNEWPMILIGSLNLPGIFLTLYGFLKYRNSQ